MNNLKFIAPNLLTFANLLFGFSAIIFISQQAFTQAGWMIIAAAACDGIDGTVARLLDSTSRFGMLFDGFADVISFGAAPSLLVYVLYFQELGLIGILISSSFLLVGVTRLIRYNFFDEGSAENIRFNGLPITVAALLLVTMFLSGSRIPSMVTIPSVFGFVIIILNLLMIGNLKYHRLHILLHLKSMVAVVTIAMIIAILIVILLVDPRCCLFLSVALYILSAPAEWLLIRLRSGFVSTHHYQEENPS